MKLEQIAQVAIYAHAALGGIALVAGTFLLLLKKGTPRHRLLGRGFHFTMLFSCILSLGISVLPNHYSPFLFSIGIFSIYLLLTGKRAISYRKKSNKDLGFDKALSWGMIVTAIAMMIGYPLYSGSFNIILGVFGFIGLLLSGRDLYLYKDVQEMKNRGLRLHIGKMMGGYIAAFTAFLVVNEVFPGMIGWFLPSILGTIYIRYSLRKFPLGPRSQAVMWVWVGFISLQSADAQVYTEKQTRHRFAQLNMGFDYQTHTQGSSIFLNRDGALTSFDLTQTHVPRFVIGGTHFWGHADFYIAIPLLYPQKEVFDQQTSFGSSIETVFKYYPWRIRANRVRPFVGVSISPYFFSQDNGLLEFGSGPALRHTSIPLLGGLTYNSGSHLIELGLTWNYSHEQSYFLDREQIVDIQTPPIYLNLSYRYMMETTLSAEKNWESGKTVQVTDKLASQGKLNSWFVGVGLSSAFWLGESSYNETNRPYMEPYGISLFPDFSLGYYLHKPDLNIALNYRGYTHSVETYGADQLLKRRSFGFELTKILFDYHGFTPFIGPVLSAEQIQFKERFEEQPTYDKKENKPGFGLAFGWDIRPTRIQSWILRTNLRWYPNLNLELENGEKVNFSNLEFNFIQLVVYPGRFF